MPCFQHHKYVCVISVLRPYTSLSKCQVRLHPSGHKHHENLKCQREYWYHLPALPSVDILAKRLMNLDHIVHLFKWFLNIKHDVSHNYSEFARKKINRRHITQSPLTRFSTGTLIIVNFQSFDCSADDHSCSPNTSICFYFLLATTNVRACLFRAVCVRLSQLSTPPLSFDHSVASLLSLIPLVLLNSLFSSASLAFPPLSRPLQLNIPQNSSS